MLERDVIRDWNRLKECFAIVFEHDSEVGGLADSLKQIDAFLFLCERCSTFFLRKPFRNTRSSVGTLDPCAAIGFSSVLNSLSAKAEDLLANEAPFAVSVDLNRAISGCADPYKGEESVRELPVDELVKRLKEGVISSLIGALGIDGTVINPSETIVANLLARGHRAIHVRFAVLGMPIIMRFGWQSNHLRNEFGTLNSGCEPTPPRAILAHIRRGDISIFPLPDGRLVTAWGRSHLSAQLRFAPEIINRTEDAVYPNYDFDLVIDLIRMARCSVGSVDTTLVSDGFERGLMRIADASAALGLGPQQFAYIRDWAAAEKDRIARNCGDAGISQLFWGESERTFVCTARELARAKVLLFSSGAFSKTLFKYLNFQPGACALGPVTSESYDRVLALALQALRSP